MNTIDRKVETPGLVPTEEEEVLSIRALKVGLQLLPASMDQTTDALALGAVMPWFQLVDGKGRALVCQRLSNVAHYLESFEAVRNLRP